MSACAVASDKRPMSEIHLPRIPTRPCYGHRRNPHLRFHVLLKLILTMARVSMLGVSVGVGDGRETCLIAELIKPNTLRAVDDNILKLRHLSTFATGRHMRLRRGVLDAFDANATSGRPKTHRLDTLMTTKWWLHLEQPLGVLLIGRINNTAVDVLRGAIRTIRRDRPIIAIRIGDDGARSLLKDEQYNEYEITENSTLSTLLFVPNEETEMKKLIN